MEWYLNCIKQNYTNFSGRARRKEYWMFTLINLLIVIAFEIVIAILGSMSDVLALVGAIVYLVYALGVFLPSLAVAVRRLHDTDRSGWWLLIALVPLVGSIVLLCFLCFDSTPGDNQYGANPKA